MLLLPHFVHLLIDVLKKSFARRTSTNNGSPPSTQEEQISSSASDEVLVEKPDSSEIPLLQLLKLKPDTKIYHLPLFAIHCPLCPIPINGVPSTISVSEIVTYKKKPKPDSNRPHDKPDRCHHGLMITQEGNSDVRFIPDEPYRSIGYPSNKFKVEPDKGFQKVNGGKTWMDVVNDLPVICVGCGQEAITVMEIMVTFKAGSEQAKKWGEKACRFLLVGPAEWRE